MASVPAKLILASSSGLALTGSFIGVSFGLSYIAVPALLIPPSPTKQASSAQRQTASSSDLLARHYLKIFDIGKTIGPVVGACSAASFIYASRQLPASAILPRRLFLAAAALNVLIAPFTMTVMARTNDELHRRAYAAADGEDEKRGRKEAKSGSVETYNTPELLEWWGFLNALRGVIHIGALACAVTALTI